MPTYMPDDKSPRLHSITIELTTDEANWITYLQDELGIAAYRETGKEEIAHLLLRAGMAAFVGLFGGLPEPLQKLLRRRELLPREEEEEA